MTRSSTWLAPALYSAQAQIVVPQCLHAWRAQQLQAFLQRGFPERRDEGWKYTSVAPLLERTFSLPQAQMVLTGQDLAAYHVKDSYELVFIDGIFSPGHSLLDDLPAKLVLTSSVNAAILYPDLFMQAHESSALQTLSVFHWLNGALSGDGLFLSVPDNVELTKPIHLLYLTTGGDGAAVMRHPRHVIRMGANSRAAVMEEYVGLGAGDYFHNVMTQINVGCQAQLNYYKLQREAASAFHIANTQVKQSPDSQVRAYHIALGSRLNREDLNFSLQATGAECELAGFYYPQAQQHIDFHTRIDHHQAHTRSRQYYKGMIAEHGHGVFNGKIIVHPQAQHCSAEQANHNLLLAESAEIDAKPELEVFADDVRCTHGATVGNLDLNALFYLRSRGIAEKTARHLLMSGFINEILARLPDPLLADYVRRWVMVEESL